MRHEANEADLTRKEKHVYTERAPGGDRDHGMNEPLGATQRCRVWDENEDEKIQTGGEETRFLKEKRRRRNLTLKSEREKK